MAACIRGPRTAVNTSPQNIDKQSPPHANHKPIIQIYTDWGNHYLEKARCKKLIQDLQTDFTDGVLLADLIEAVTNQKVPDVNRKPKTPAQMVENIKVCLCALDRLGVCLEGVTTKEVREGNLKSILALFFALSKHKQQQKLSCSADKHKASSTAAKQEDNMQSRLPTPLYQQQQQQQQQQLAGAQTSIPTPLLRHPQQSTAGGNPLKCQSASSSRSTSPSHSFIPTPRSSARTSLNEKQITSGQRVVSSRAPAAISSPYSTPPNKNSMLDKFKLFNPKEKAKPAVVGSAKRTSSSSGFSSARSERSDSSTSLYTEVRNSNERKDSPQNDLSKPSIRKKVVKVESKIGRPRGGSGGSKSGLQQGSQGSTNQSQQIPSGAQCVTATISTVPSPVTSTPVVTTPIKPVSLPQVPCDQKKELDSAAPTVMESSNEPLRVAGGGGSGIPKPTAVVKGVSKPTHTVAPMPPVNNTNFEPTYSSPEKEKQVTIEPIHEKQNSIGEEEEDTVNVKPMQPLLRGYNKRTIAIAPRTIPQNRGRGYRPLDTYPVRSNTERNFLDSDYCNISSGYMSDGEMLQMKCNDIPDGYISESGASLYQRIQEHRGIPPELNHLGKQDHRSYSHSKLKPKSQGDIKEPGKVTDEIVDLSGTENHTKRIVNGGNGGGGRGSGEGPPSPAQPHPVIYRVVSSRHVKKSDSSQQTENSAFRQVSSSQWKGGNGSSGGRTELDGRSREKRNPAASGNISRKPEKKRVSSGSREELDVDCNSGERGSKQNGNGGRGDGKSKTRGVTPGFGYAKRPSNSNCKDGAKTVPVSGVPRTKVKISGGTQTEVQYSSGSQMLVRERLLQSLPKGASMGGGVGSGSRHVPDPGSLSDSNYAEIPASPYSSWLRHSGAYTASLPTRTSASGLSHGGAMVEADSIESLPAQLHHRASLTHARIIGHPQGSATAPRLSRSNSISYLRDRTFPRSTKSEKLYPSMLQRSEEVEPYYSIPYNMGIGQHHSSQPTSPTPSQVSQGTSGRYNYPISPISASPSSHGINRNSPYTGVMSKMTSKDDDVHGSAVSLVSTASSLYSTPEEKQAHEVRKLRRELCDAQEKVLSLTSQLSTNAHVVSAFEQSLSNMTQRLQQLTASAEKKDSELMELKKTIELLRKQSVEAGLTSAHSPSLARRHTINTTEPSNETNMSRQLSTDSVSSLNSLSSACSLSSTAQNQDGEKKKKRGWLRSSFNKAFSRTKKNKNSACTSDNEESRGITSDVSAPSSPLLNAPHHMNGNDTCQSDLHSSPSSNALYDRECGPEVVEELKKQLREKDLVLTDIRLEALSSAHQLESLKDTVIKMRNEMFNLKQDNERLQRIVTSKSLTSSQSSLPRNDSLERRFSMNDAIPDQKYDLFAGDPDGKRVTVSVYLGCHGSYHKYIEEGIECPIASLSISSKTKWDMLDAMIRRAFKDYIERIDPVGGLGLSADSIWSYHVGEVVRYRDSRLPDLLPCGYLVGDTSTITVCLKGALHSGSLDALTFDSLIPKSIAQRYISLLTDYRRIILCGPSGTGKSYLANKLAEFLVIRAGKESTAESVATFNVEHKSSKELRQYLSNIAEQCETNAGDLPSVIILDNLHQASSLGEVFNGFLNAKYSKCPYIIGTMNQATCSTTNLQLHHNFRWILCANHMEPVKGFLARFLKRRLIETEVRSGYRSGDLIRIIDWMPRIWQHLNQFLETHSSSDVTIGPRLFLSCPMECDGSQVWFTDLWNYSVVPYLLEAVREGIQLYGRRAPWQDPTMYIAQSYPWTSEAVHGGSEALIRMRPEDVGYDPHSSTGSAGNSVKSISSTQNDAEGDPLLNMLMRLQEAANYSSPHSNDSDSNTNSDNMNGSGLESTL